MKQVKFVISEFKNPSGEIAFRVSGWLDGKRIRKNLPTYAEAKVEAKIGCDFTIERHMAVAFFSQNGLCALRPNWFEEKNVRCMAS